MVKITKSTFVVFDLDDTLYKENEYHDSGILAVSQLVKKLYNVDLSNKLFQWKKEGVKDLLKNLCKELKLPLKVKETFIWQYRLHSPSLNLCISAQELLKKLNDYAAGVAILTDGRSISQRLKLSALGLLNFPVYISEEWGSEKPDELRFNEIMNKHPASSYIYIGDNPQKDFKAPNELGWSTVGIFGNEHNIHSQVCDGLSDAYRPEIWFDDLNQIRDLIC